MKQLLQAALRHKLTNLFNTQGPLILVYVQGGSNMTGTDLYVNKPHCAAAVRP